MDFSVQGVLSEVEEEDAGNESSDENIIAYKEIYQLDTAKKTYFYSENIYENMEKVEAMNDDDGQILPSDRRYDTEGRFAYLEEVLR